MQPLPRQALGVRVREATVDDHDRDALRPGLALVRRHHEGKPRQHMRYLSGYFRRLCLG